MKTTAKLSFMMFVEWFIWGAWFVPLWLWLSKSGFSAGEIGWSYACTAIAAILSPILVGSITDRFFSAQKVLAVLMFAGALLMYFAAQQTTFAGFFPLLLTKRLERGRFARPAPVNRSPNHSLVTKNGCCRRHHAARTVAIHCAGWVKILLNSWS